MNSINQTPPNSNSGANNQGRVAPPATGPGAVSKGSNKAAPKDDGFSIKSVTPKGLAVDKSKTAKTTQPTGDAYKFWDDYFLETKTNPKAAFKTPAAGAIFLFETVSEMLKAKKLDHCEAAIKGYLKHHGKDAEPWMYELLVKCIESRKGTTTESIMACDRDVKQTLGFAAYLAKKTKNPNDMLRIADMMVLRGYYETIGIAGYETNVGELIDLVTEKVPTAADPLMMSVNLATHDKDPKRMAKAAEGLLSLGWMGFDDQMRRDLKEQVTKLADALKVDGRQAEADTLMASLAESEARDVYVKLTWKGEADIDLAIAEPLGATAKYQNPRTVFGGAIVKNGYGNHPEEVYVCPRGFDGDYTVTVEKIVDYDEAKPVQEATLEIIRHEGTAQEQRETHKISLAKPEPFTVKLTGGRRKNVLPFIAPPKTPAIVENPKAKTKAASKPPTAPANQGPPFR